MTKLSRDEAYEIYKRMFHGANDRDIVTLFAEFAMEEAAEHVSNTAHRGEVPNEREFTNLACERISEAMSDFLENVQFAMEEVQFDIEYKVTVNIRR